MRTSFYLIGLILSATLFTSCIKEPPCPRNLQKVEFLLDSAHVSLADYISMEPGDEVVVYKAEYSSLNRADMRKFDKSNAIQQKYRFDGEVFVPVTGSYSFDYEKSDYYYCTEDTELHIQVLMYDNSSE